MANVNIDPKIWRREWFSELDQKYKLFWFYILCNCDLAGVWDMNLKLASFEIGEQLDKEKLLKAFAGRIFEIDGGQKWIIKKFVKFQYGINPSEFNIKNNMHVAVLKIIKKHGLSIDLWDSVPTQSRLSPDSVPTDSMTIKDGVDGILGCPKEQVQVQEQAKQKQRESKSQDQEQEQGLDQVELKQTFSCFARQRGVLDKALIIARESCAIIESKILKRIEKQARAPDVELMLNILDGLIAEFGACDVIVAINHYDLVGSGNGKAKSLDDLFALTYKGHGVMAKFGGLIADAERNPGGIKSVGMEIAQQAKILAEERKRKMAENA